MGAGDVPGHAPGAALRRQARAAVASLARPATYAGVVREVALGAVHLAAYPFGVAPAALGPPRSASVRARALLALEPETACMPVVLVHGYVHNRSAFLALARALKRVGFAYVHGVNYNPLAERIEESAARLAAEVEPIIAATGADRCVLVGHSLGGLVARYYVQALGGEDTVDTVVTLGTPHRGTLTSYLGVGAAVAQLRPNSPFLRALDAQARPGPVRWIALYSDLDWLVTPAVNGKLSHPALRAHNVRVRDTGHLSMLLSGRVIAAVLEFLLDGSLARPSPLDGVAALPAPAQQQRRDVPSAAGAGVPAARAGGGVSARAR
jgi:triacylglycerol lipase